MHWTKHLYHAIVCLDGKLITSWCVSVGKLAGTRGSVHRLHSIEDVMEAFIAESSGISGSFFMSLFSYNGVSFTREQNLFCVIAFSSKHWLNNTKVSLEVEKQEAVKGSVEWMDFVKQGAELWNERIKVGNYHASLRNLSLSLFFFFKTNKVNKKMFAL